jgi:PAS domain S-box-containing protein
MERTRDDAAHHFAALVASSDDAIISKDLNGVITSWNPAAERMFGFTAAEAIGQSIRVIIPPERHAEEDDVIASVRRGEGVRNRDTIRVRKDGAVVPISLTVSPIRDASGTVIGASTIAHDITERKRVQAEIERARAFTDRVVNTSPDLLFVYDVVEGRNVFVNSRLTELFGYAPEEFLSPSSNVAEQIVPAEDMPTVTDAFRRLDHARDDEVIEYEHRFRRADGAYCSVRVRASVFARTPDGRAKQIIGHCMDVTETKATEERRRDLQQRLELLVSASATALMTPTLDAVLPALLATARELVAADGYAVWLLDSKSGVWRVVSSHGVSEEFSQQQLSREEGSGVIDALLAHPTMIEDVRSAPVLAVRRDAYAKEGVRSILVVPLAVAGALLGTMVFYYRSTHASSEVDVQVATALANLAAAAIRSAKLYDELQRAERASAFLVEASTILGSSLDYQDTLKRIAHIAVPSVADWCAVDVVDESGTVKRLAVAHTDPTKIQQLHLLEARYPPEPSSPYGVHEVVRTKAPVMMEFIPDELLVRRARDPEHLRLLRELGLSSYMCVPLLSRGRVLGVMTFVAAESRHRYTQADLALAEQIASRSALAIENAYAYEEARRASTLKDEFLATLSHELRTPLNAILGYTRMLRSGLLSADRYSHAIDVVDRNATSLTQLVEDVLDVSRIVSGKIRLNVQPVDIPGVLRNAVASVLPAADAKGVRVQTVIDPFAPPVSGDPERLQQIAWNLLSNAVKFTPRGGRVQVRLERVDSHVEIVVSDTGVGIKPEFLPHVFERFRQADSRFTREHGGLGLGLAITRQIVEMHGGTIQAASGGEGQGATFRVKLPIMIAHPGVHAGAARAYARPDAEERGVTVPSLAGVRVLVVDDDPDALVLISEILQAAGAHVTTADSASEALDRLRAAVPDVLVTDIGMPHMDGFELIRLVRESPEPAIRNLPAAALTAYARSEDRTRALDTGFQLHLAKPIDPAELMVAVRRLARTA